MRRSNTLALAALLVGCGGATQQREAGSAGDAPAMAAESAPAQVRAAFAGLRDPTRIEPQVLVPIELEPRPPGPVPVSLARLELASGATYRPPAGPCQDVLLMVRGGELRAVGSGIAPPEAPSTLYPGDAVRFGPEGDGLVQNLGEGMARTVVAFVRPEGAPSVAHAGQGGCPVERAEDPLVTPLRAASVRTTPALEVLGGGLRVRVLLDDDGQGARYGGLSVLEGDPGLVVPQHRHPESAEILYVERGNGILRIGELAYRVRPGAALYIPEGVLHSYEGDEEPLWAIQVYTPSGAEQRFRGAAR